MPANPIAAKAIMLGVTRVEPFFAPVTGLPSMKLFYDVLFLNADGNSQQDGLNTIIDFADNAAQLTAKLVTDIQVAALSLFGVTLTVGDTYTVHYDRS
jgi:hypothetical protein